MINLSVFYSKILLICFILCLATIIILNKKIRYIKAEMDKQFRRAEFNAMAKKILELWHKQKQEGKEVKTYFVKNDIKSVAIYGMTQTAVILQKELVDAGIRIVCGIDRNAKTGGTGIISKKPSDLQAVDIIGKVDAIIVTPVYDFSAIYDLLYEKVGDKVPILGLDEILCEI